jgi:hypothetical protein
LAFFRKALQKTIVSQIVGDNNVVHSSHDKLDLSGIRGASEVRVDFLCL